MRILVTGGRGFIGRAVLHELRGAGHDASVLDVADDPAHDVRAADAVAGAVAGQDAVVHLAAKVGVEQSFADVPDYVSHNDHGTAVLLAAAADAGVARVVLGSSMVVYGDGLARCPEHGPVPPGPRRPEDLAQGRFEPPCPRCGRRLDPLLVTEDAPLDPRSGYAVTKLTQEQLVALWARQTDAAATALRFHNVYGPGLPRDTPYAGVAAIFRSAVLAGRAPQVTEDGQQRRDFVHVRDVARAVRVAVEAGGPTGEVRAFNVGSGTVRTVGEVAAALADAAGAPPPVLTGAARLTDVRHITASSELAERELGWRATEDFAAGVRELLADG